MTTTTPLPPAPITMPSAGRITGAAIASRTVRYALLLIFVILLLVPLYVMVVTSFKSAADIRPTTAWNLPQRLSVDGWAKAWRELSGPLFRSLMLAIVAAVVSSMLGSLNGFVFSKWRFPGANIVFTLFLFGMFIPYQAVIIPLQEMMLTIQGWGLPEGVGTLIVVHVIYGIPICTLIFRNYYATTVPTEILEAGKVDGAGMLRTYWSIVLPISIPGFVVTLIWQFTSAWNDFLFALFLTNANNGPVTFALNSLASGQNPDYASNMAGALLASLPTLAVYIILGKYFIGGLMSGSVK
ncbi:MAG TPA: carbohydrate ABC transporter permease [Nakamurella sp.]|nr:carbohydrate ABC transporter permease [Nakamurella sp.]